MPMAVLKYIQYLQELLTPSHFPPLSQTRSHHSLIDTMAWPPGWDTEVTLSPPHNGKAFCLCFYTGPSEAYLGPSQKFQYWPKRWPASHWLIRDRGDGENTTHPLQNNKISWKDIHDLVAPAQVMCPPPSVPLCYFNDSLCYIIGLPWHLATP